MITNTVSGAIYLSILDMILLMIFLLMIGAILKLFPIVNTIIKLFKK